MPLQDIVKDSRVFIDTNIFFFEITHHSNLWGPCHAFLERIGSGEIAGVVSPIVWNELFHQLLQGEVAKARGIQPFQAAKLAKRKPQTLKGLKAYSILEIIQKLPNILSTDVLASDDRDFRRVPWVKLYQP